MPNHGRHALPVPAWSLNHPESLGLFFFFFLIHDPFGPTGIQRVPSLMGAEGCQLNLTGPVDFPASLHSVLTSGCLDEKWTLFYFFLVPFPNPPTARIYILVRPSIIIIQRRGCVFLFFLFFRFFVFTFSYLSQSTRRSCFKFVNPLFGTPRST